jgi:hypothetical protein
MVGSAGTSRPAARRSQACRRACPAHDAGDRGAPAATRLGPPANSQPLARLCAYRTRAVRRRWAVVKDVGVRPPNDGQAAADDARPRPPEVTKARRRYPSGGARRACRSSAPRARSAPPSAIHLPPLRRRLRLRRLAREAVQRLAAALVRAHHQAYKHRVPGQHDAFRVQSLFVLTTANRLS